MFIPRHPVVEEQFCSYDETETSGGVGGVVAYAGTVVYLYSEATNQEPMVRKQAHIDSSPPSSFGLLMQKVKTGYHQVHPSGFYMPGDLGSSDVIVQPRYSNAGVINGTKAAPVGVAHLGIWDTVHYTCVKTATDGVSSITTHMKPGMDLHAAADEVKLTNSAVPSVGTSTTDADIGAAVKGLTGVTVARVLKGASAAKCQANIDNVTLYPIRVKLLV